MQDQYNAHSGSQEADQAKTMMPQRKLPPMLPPGSKEREYARHTWHDAYTGHGTVLVRLPILGMEVERARRIQEELIELGMRPEISNSKSLGGLTIRLRGADAIKFREINPAPPLFLRKEWQYAQDGRGQVITRLPRAGIRDTEYVRLVLELQQAGFTPSENDSATLGPTIRLSGHDALRLQKMRDAMKP